MSVTSLISGYLSGGNFIIIQYFFCFFCFFWVFFKGDKRREKIYSNSKLSTKRTRFLSHPHCIRGGRSNGLHLRITQISHRDRKSRGGWRAAGGRRWILRRAGSPLEAGAEPVDKLIERINQSSSRLR